MKTNYIKFDKMRSKLANGNEKNTFEHADRVEKCVTGKWDIKLRKTINYC